MPTKYLYNRDITPNMLVGGQHPLKVFKDGRQVNRMFINSQGRFGLRLGDNLVHEKRPSVRSIIAIDVDLSRYPKGRSHNPLLDHEVSSMQYFHRSEALRKKPQYSQYLTTHGLNLFDVRFSLIRVTGPVRDGNGNITIREISPPDGYYYFFVNKKFEIIKMDTAQNTVNPSGFSSIRGENNGYWNHSKTGSGSLLGFSKPHLNNKTNPKELMYFTFHLSIDRVNENNYIEVKDLQSYPIWDWEVTWATRAKTINNSSGGGLSEATEVRWS